MNRLLWLGLDDTDMPDTPGTNQLAKQLAVALRPACRCLRIVRHQLWADPLVPMTSQNGSASLVLQPQRPLNVTAFWEEVTDFVRSRAAAGSDPGVCLALRVDRPVEEFGRRCQQQWCEQTTARSLADQHGIYLIGLGGTQGGVIGALAAVGLVHRGDDGRIVYWRDADTGAGVMTRTRLRELDVDVVELETDRPVECGDVDVGKHLRPNLRGHRAVLYVRPAQEKAVPWEAVRLC
jgi:tRNA(Ile2) C34 agmatinyltransferase TiaS